MQDAAINLSEHLEVILEALSATLTTYGLDVVGAIVTLILGVWFAGYASRLTGRVLGNNTRVDAMLAQFFASGFSLSSLSLSSISSASKRRALWQCSQQPASPLDSPFRAH